MTNEEPENQTLPLIMHGHKVTPIFLALVGPVLIFGGVLAVYLSIINFQDLVLFQKIVVPLLNIVGILAGGAMVYSLLRKFPYKTIFTADEMIQHYLTHTHTRSMQELVDIQLDYEIRRSRGVDRRLYRITFIDADGKKFCWIPHEFDFPIAYHYATAREMANGWLVQLQSAYLGREPKK